VVVVCCQVSATGQSLVQRNPTECDVSEYDREGSIMKRPWPIKGCSAMGKNNNLYAMCILGDALPNTD
jgi:hypothetical protein